MQFKQDWVNNQGIRIHYIDNEVDDKTKTPLLICPGLSESVDNYMNFIDHFQSRRCIALSFRGRGKSDSPESGYSLEHHVSDVSSLVNKLNLKKFCIMGNSRGVSYELGYAIANPELIKGLIVIEYTPEHKKMPVGWAEEYLNSYWDDTIGSQLMKAYVVKGIEIESKQISYLKDLNKIKCPTLLMRGEKEESLLSLNDVILYVKNLKTNSIRIESFKNAGHDIQSDDFKRFIQVINSFLISID